MPSGAGCHKNHNLVGISGLCSENQRGLWRGLEIQRNETASEVNSTCTSAIMQTCCLVPNPHYSMPSMHFGSRAHVSQPFVLHTSQKCIDREGLGRHVPYRDWASIFRAGKVAKIITDSKTFWYAGHKLLQKNVVKVVKARFPTLWSI